MVIDSGAGHDAARHQAEKLTALAKHVSAILRKDGRRAVAHLVHEADVLVKHPDQLYSAMHRQALRASASAIDLLKHPTRYAKLGAGLAGSVAGETVGQLVGGSLGAALGPAGTLIGAEAGAIIGGVIGARGANHLAETRFPQESDADAEQTLKDELSEESSARAGRYVGETIGQVIGEALLDDAGGDIGQEVGKKLGSLVGKLTFDRFSKQSDDAPPDQSPEKP